MSAVAVALGLIVTGGLTAVTFVNYHSDEHRLTSVDVQLTAAALDVAPVDVERRLDGPLNLVAGGAPVGAYTTGISSSLGKAGPFASSVLYRLRGSTPVVVGAVGAPTLAGPTSRALLGVIAAAVRSHALAVVWIRRPHAQRLGFALSASGPAGTFAAYASEVLPPNGRVTIPVHSPVGDLNFAIYFGPRARPGDLMETSASTLPLGSGSVSSRVSFGDRVITLVAAPRSPLEGGFAASIPWGVLGVGLLMTGLTALMAERLTRRRHTAELLAEENRRLYQVQRRVAETLQRSLLPRRLPELPSLEVAYRYQAGGAGVEVGGDWYDLVLVDGRTAFFSVGDVSGRGLQAATIMSMLRNSITAYASEGSEPEEVLARLNRLIDLADDGRFATLLCGRFDLLTGVGMLANAGHLEPLVISEGACTGLRTVVGLPVGVGGEYVPVRFSLRPGDVLLCYTDGLVERRHESLTDNIERLRQLMSIDLPLESLLDRALQQVGAGALDDIALMGMRWTG